MNINHVTDHPILGYLDNRSIVRAARHDDRSILRPFIQTTGWLLAGAVLGSVAMAGGVWMLLSI